jgi:hypothetical protein
MIRKMLVFAAAVAMPAAAMAGVTAVAGGGIASAKALPPVTGSCGLTGSVTFAKPGLSFNGSLTNKSTETSKSAITPGGGICGTKGIKNNIVSGTSPCATTTPKAPECTLAPAKTLAKDPNFYDTASSLATAGVSNIVTSLSGGIPAVNNGTKVTLQVTAPNTSAILPGGVCGTTVGFHLSGAVTNGGAAGHYVLNICLIGDTGTSTTGAFFTDYAAAAGGNTAITIAKATIASPSSLTYST